MFKENVLEKKGHNDPFDTAIVKYVLADGATVAMPLMAVMIFFSRTH